jgi:hypothetical protein
MSVVLAPSPIFRGVANDGTALVGGQLFTYIAGTTTPQATWIDSTQTTQNTNPVILNSRGEANVWINPALIYKFVLQDSAGNPIWTVDQINGVGQSIVTKTFTPALAFQGGGSVTQTVQYANYSVVGNVVTFVAKINWSAIAAPSGNVTVTGLPIAPNIAMQFVPISVWWAGLNLTGTTFLMLLQAGLTTALTFNMTTTSSNNLQGSALQASGQLVFGGSYQI